jgi:predicted PurR-regulated permease PerM
MEQRHEEAIITRFAAVARATIKGTLLIALVQGTLSGLTLWIFGVPSPILWAVVATLLAIIPLVGVWLVLYPAALIQLLTGHLWQGLGIVLVTVLVIVNVDNLLRPRLVGQETGMHDLMVFFSTLGGIGLFGPVGFIVGPVIAALFLSILDIYSTEFKTELDGLGPPLPGPPGDPLEAEPATVPKRVAAGGERG